MTFQFQCPRGHLLSGEESQAGQQSLCPMCGVMFIVPAPVGYAAMPGYPGFPVPPPPVPASPYPPAPPAPVVEEPQIPANPFEALKAAAAAAEAAQGQPAPAEEAAPPPPEPVVLHIPCPNGHELETPEEMLDQEVLCPHCNAQFVLRRTNSVEYKRKREEEERLKEIKAGKFWLNMAIVAVVLVVLLLVGLIVTRIMMHTPVSP